ncbi:hypothetical protein TNCV_738591 [Trichonephila clavipes]|nr:hypothetical protein TNCV_738591 [Trichonephila clavipes]
MNQFLEQRNFCAIFEQPVFCVKLGGNGVETLEMLRKANGNREMKQCQIFIRLKRFREGRESVNDDDRSERPSTSQTDDSVQNVRHVLDKGRQFSV